jgi:predicted kinase
LTKPILIVVTGRPAAGKTTLAHALARSIGCPLISRDELKEGYAATVGAEAARVSDVKHRIYDTFFETIGALLAKGITLVAEAAFQHRLWAEKLDALSAIADVRIVICTLAPELARERFIARGLADSNRELVHGDHAVSAAREGVTLPIGSYEPPQMPVPTLMVDTTEGYKPDLAAIARFARERNPAA